MTAPKNPYEFTDSILVRELRRRIDRKYDDRLDLLLEVVELRLWGRAVELEALRSSQSALTLQRLKRLEQRQDSVVRELEENLDFVKTLNDRLPPRPRPKLLPSPDELLAERDRVITSSELLEDWRHRVDYLVPPPPEPRPRLTLLPGDSA